MKTITVMRAGTGRAATSEELRAAVAGKPLPPPDAAVSVIELRAAHEAAGKLMLRERALGRRGNAQQCADFRLLVLEAIREIEG